jgi:hypothetical protein
MRTLRVLGVFTAIVTICSQQAEASFHEWKIDQVYSNASGSVQYVDFLLTNPTDNEQFLSFAQFASNSHTMGFTNLPSQPVNGQHFLIATPGFASIAGVTPDYTFPATPFFNRSGDTLNYAFGVDTLTFTALPGGNSAVGHSGVVLAKPTNFAGVVGNVPEPATGVLLLVGAACLWAFIRRSRRAGLSSS